MAYANYTYYVNTYHGTLLSETDFNSLAEKASDYISAYTYGMSDINDLTEAEITLVKKCNCAVAEVLSECGVSDLSTGVKSSESVGSWHISYAVSNNLGNSPLGVKNTVIFNEVKLYLGRTRLMYYGLC